MRLRWLVAILVVLLALAPLARWWLLAKPAPPPASAGVALRMRYFAERIAANPADADAYVQLGALEERTGYFTDAVRRLTAAQALGADPRKVLPPLGRALTNLARYSEAEAALTKAVALLPSDLEAAANLAGLYHDLGADSRAASTLRALLDRRPDIAAPSSPAVVDATERLMYCFSDAKDTEMVARMADNLTRIAPDHPEGFAIGGKLALERGDPRQALKLLQSAIRLAPNEPALCYVYGLALAKNGHEADAEKQWRKTVALNPGAIDAYYRLAEYHGARKEYRLEAEALQAVALRSAAHGPAIPLAALAFDKARDKVASSYWRSVDLRLRGRYAEALAQAKLVAADPSWRQRGLYAEAECLRRLHRVREYVDTVRTIASGGSAQGDLLLASAYETADMLDAQVATLKRALAANPRDPGLVHFRLAEAARRAGKRDEAESELKQSVALQPDNARYHEQLGGLYFERRSSGGDRLALAIREFQRCVQLSPDYGYAFQRLGNAYAAAGDLHRAAQNLEHAIDLQPGDGAPYGELGRVYARQGRREESERMLRLFNTFVAYDLNRQTLITRARASRRDASAHVALADFLEKSGDIVAAGRYYRRAFALKPDPAIAARLRRVDGLMGRNTAMPPPFGRKN